MLREPCDSVVEARWARTTTSKLQATLRRISLGLGIRIFCRGGPGAKRQARSLAVHIGAARSQSIMLHPALSRFHLALAIALLFAGVALVFGSVFLLIVVVLAFFALIGFGVAIPQLRFFGPYVCRGTSTNKCVAL